MTESTSPEIAAALSRIRSGSPFASDRERCIAIHDFVRDTIAFGFTAGFEGVAPERTLAVRRGHCNAQGDLFRALLSAAGIPARLRFVQIDKRILAGAVPAPVHLCLPTTLFHAVVEVCVAGSWMRTDSYLFPPAAFLRQQHLLARSGLPVGFGLTRESRCVWDAAGDSFSQACPSDLHDGNPVFSSLAQALAARAGNNTLLGIHFNRWLGGMPPFLQAVGERYLNSRL